MIPYVLLQLQLQNSFVESFSLPGQHFYPRLRVHERVPVSWHVPGEVLILTTYMWLFELRWNPPITADIRDGIQSFVQGIVALYDYWNLNGDRIFLQRASCETPRILNLWRRYPTKWPTFVTHRGCGSPESDIKSASGPFTEVFDSSQVPAIIYINHCPTSGDSRRSWHHWWNFESDAWWAGPGSIPVTPPKHLLLWCEPGGKRFPPWFARYLVPVSIWWLLYSEFINCEQAFWVPGLSHCTHCGW